MKSGMTALALLGAATAANAADYHFKLTGTLTEMTHPGYPEWEEEYGFEPPLQIFEVGDKVTFSARVNSDQVVDFGNGSKVAYFYASSPGRIFDLSLGVYAWDPANEYLDGDPVITGIEDLSGTLPHLAGPSVLFKDGKILGFAGWLIPAWSVVPLMELGSGYMTGTYDPYGDGPAWQLRDPETMYVTSSFNVTADPGLYGNRYIGASFNGVWDFDGSSAGIPEPASWALMIAGFGLMGGAIRRRRAVAGAETG